MPHEQDTAARVRALWAHLAAANGAPHARPRLLPAEEIERIERDQPAPLAEAYRWFLLLFTLGAGRLLVGTDVYPPAVLGLRDAAADLLAENEVPFALAATDRVFLMHQGCQFAFLRGPGPDPEVWSYSEGEWPYRTHTCFTDWLAAEIDEQVRWLTRSRSR